jgi:hypothetical protein
MHLVDSREMLEPRTTLGKKKLPELEGRRR